MMCQVRDASTPMIGNHHVRAARVALRASTEVVRALDCEGVEDVLASNIIYGPAGWIRSQEMCLHLKGIEAI